MQPQDPLLTTPIPGLDPTTILTESVCSQFHLHAVEVYPQECVGYVKQGSYWPLENVSHDPENRAAVPSEVMLELLQDGVDAVCHSHPDGPNAPSAADMLLQMEMGIPHALICSNGQATTPPLLFGREICRAPLVGRGFIHGVQDCFACGLDFYSLVMGIELEDFPRDWEWWGKHKDAAGGLYLENFRKWGFKEVDDGLEFGDVFLLKAGRTVVPNHCGIYIGDHLMLHHLAGRSENDHTRLSTVEPVIRWREHGRIERVLRHGG